MAINDKLKQVLNDLKKAEKNAALDVLAWPDPRTRPSAQLRKTQGLEARDRLVKEYGQLFSRHAFRVFTIGPRAQEFAAFAANHGAVTVDGSELYTILAQGVAQSQDPKRPSFGPHQVVRLTAELMFYSKGQGYVSVMSPRPRAKDLDAPTPTAASLLEKVRAAIRSTNADDLNLLHMERNILAKAIRADAKTDIIPVIITGLTTEEIQTLFKTLFPGSAAMELTADEKSTDEDLLKLINAKIRSVKTTGNKKK
jgi:hypothetical protein